jgi:SAM-dependent methyltransferase
MNKKMETIETYNKSATALAERWADMKPRTADIEETFRFITKENPKVLEIGCGSGRDAAEILKRTNDYVGFDVSEGLLAVARKENPTGIFQQAFSANLEPMFRIRYAAVVILIVAGVLGYFVYATKRATAIGLLSSASTSPAARTWSTALTPARSQSADINDSLQTLAPSNRAPR